MKYMTLPASQLFICNFVGIQLLSNGILFERKKGEWSISNLFTTCNTFIHIFRLKSATVCDFLAKSEVYGMVHVKLLVVVDESEYFLESTNRFMKWRPTWGSDRITKHVREISANPRQAQRQSSCVNQIHD